MHSIRRLWKAVDGPVHLRDEVTVPYTPSEAADDRCNRPHSIRFDAGGSVYCAAVMTGGAIAD